MVLFNYSTKELTAKIVYYGPGLCGKTTNLQFIHKNLGDNVKGKMLSLATKTDRTLFFDFLPMDLGEIRGMKTRMQLYTVPGQVFYNETRKLVLKGVDGLVFVADSQKEMLGPNIESFKNLEENLKGHGIKLAEMPHVLQFNKRDLPKLSSMEELNAAINKFNAPFYESVATTGIGIQDTLKAITKLVLLHLTKKYDPRTGEVKRPAAVAVETPEPVAVAAGRTASGAITLSAVEAPEAPTARKSKPKPAPAPAPSRPATPSFAAEEIDGLMDEIADAPDAAIAGDIPDVAAPPAARSTEAERRGAPRISIDVEHVTGGSCELDGVDLFNDPSLEVAQLSPGQMREILIPVEVTNADQGTKRYKLSLRLHMGRAS